MRHCAVWWGNLKADIGLMMRGAEADVKDEHKRRHGGPPICKSTSP